MTFDCNTSAYALFSGGWSIALVGRAPLARASALVPRRVRPRSSSYSMIYEVSSRHGRVGCGTAHLFVFIIVAGTGSGGFCHIVQLHVSLTVHNISLASLDHTNLSKVRTYIQCSLLDLLLGHPSQIPFAYPVIFRRLGLHDCPPLFVAWAGIIVAESASLGVIP